MGLKKVRGIVLRLINVKDYDAYINILSKDLGLVSVYAKGLRRKKSPLLSKTQIFTFADFIIFENKGRFSLNDVDIVYQFMSVSEDMLRLTAASQVVELIMDQTHEAHEAYMFYELLLRFLYALDRKEKSVLLLTCISEMKILSSIGYTPRLDYCLTCERNIESDEAIYFDFNNAGILCEKDQKKATQLIYADIRKVSYNLLEALQYIESSDVARLFAIDANRDFIEELYQFVLHYKEVRLDKTYDKFKFFREFGFQEDLF